MGQAQGGAWLHGSQQAGVQLGLRMQAWVTLFHVEHALRDVPYDMACFVWLETTARCVAGQCCFVGRGGRSRVCGACGVWCR